jgi:hypothetical protein
MEMLELLAPVLTVRDPLHRSAFAASDTSGPQHWEEAELASVVVGSGSGRAFCAGGDVAGASCPFRSSVDPERMLAITSDLHTEEGRSRAMRFFELECVLPGL